MGDLQLINAVCAGLAVLGAWLIVRPQQVENQALHRSIDNNTKALKELTSLISEMRMAQAAQKENISNLWHRFRDLNDDVDKLRQAIPACRGGSEECLKK